MTTSSWRFWQSASTSGCVGCRVPSNFPPKGIPFTSQICVFSRVIFQQAAIACPARTKPVYRENFLTDSSPPSGGRALFSNSPKGAVVAWQWPWLSPSSCADAETTSLYSFSHWMSYFDLGLVLGQLSLWRPDMFQAYSFRDSPLLCISIKVFLSTLLSRAGPDSTVYWEPES